MLKEDHVSRNANRDLPWRREAVVPPTSPSTEHQLQAGCVDGATCLLVVWFEVGGFVDCLGLSVVETKGFGARGEEFLAPEKFL